MSRLGRRNAVIPDLARQVAVPVLSAGVAELSGTKTRIRGHQSITKADITDHRRRVIIIGADVIRVVVAGSIIVHRSAGQREETCNNEHYYPTAGGAARRLLATAVVANTRGNVH